MSDEAPDLRDLYGRCRAKACACLLRASRGEGPWLGRACVLWEPLGPRTIEELVAHQQAAYERRLQNGK